MKDSAILTKLIKTLEDELKEADAKIKELEHRLAQYEQPIQKIELFDLPDHLKEQAG